MGPLGKGIGHIDMTLGIIATTTNVYVEYSKCHFCILNFVVQVFESIDCIDA